MSPEQRRVVLDAGHTVSTPETHHALLKEVLDWWDKYL
jgi:dipeptidyl aminopeptidase/acylaminoacyl peptidase